MGRRHLIILVLLPFGSLALFLGNPATSEDYVVATEDNNFNCSADPPSCHHHSPPPQDDDDPVGQHKPDQKRRMKTDEEDDDTTSSTPKDQEYNYFKEDKKGLRTPTKSEIDAFMQDLETDEDDTSSSTSTTTTTPKDQEYNYSKEDNNLPSSAEKIKAQIRKEAITRQLEPSDHDDLQYWQSAEDVKDQIRREALLQSAAAAEVLADVDHATKLSPADTTGRTNTNTNTGRTTTTTTQSSNDDSVVLDGQVKTQLGDTTYSSSSSSTTTTTTTTKATYSRPTDPIVEKEETVEDIAVDQTSTREESGTVAYLDLDDEPAQVELEAKKKNKSDSEALPLVPKPQEEEAPLPPIVVPTGADSRPMIQTSSSTDGNIQNNSTDDRTMLDIFGEQAKDFLTRRVIPETDKECRWDWRSVRCEPSCQCQFQPRRGDYHIGRSCRLLPAATIADDCVPKRSWNDHAAARRFLSLAQQSAILVRAKAVRAVTKVVDQAKLHYERVQDRVCPPMPCYSKTLPEMILCHRTCDQDDDDDDDDDDTIPFAEKRSLLMKLQNRFALNPLKEPTEDTGWEF